MRDDAIGRGRGSLPASIWDTRGDTDVCVLLGYSVFADHARPDIQTLLAPNEFYLGRTHHRNTLVVGIRSEHPRSIVRRCQVRLAMSPDAERAHHIDIRPEAIPSISVQQFTSRPAHDVHARIDHRKHPRPVTVV